METEISLPCSQELAATPYPYPDECSLHVSVQDPFNILPSTPKSFPNGIFSSHLGAIRPTVHTLRILRVEQ